MQLGLSVYDIDPLELVELAVEAERSGFDAVWLGEHIVLPVGYRTDHPTSGSADNTSHRRAIIDPATVLIDPLIALSAVAASTSTIRLATGIYLLPLRHPLAIARMTSTLQTIARGRLLLGVGSGWLREEFDALGVPFEGRGERFDETISVLRTAWRGGEFSHSGSCYSFDRVMLSPSEIDVPLILGGNTERALRRAARIGDGWFSSGNPTFDEACRLRDRMVDLCEEHGRASCIPLFVRMAGRDPVELDRYRAEGFEHVTVWANQLWPASGTLESKREHFAEAVRELRP